MRLTVDITPEAGVELSRQAAASGHNAEAQAATVLEGALHLARTNPVTPGGEEAHFSERVIQVCAMFRGLTEDVDFCSTSSNGRQLDIS